MKIINREMGGGKTTALVEIMLRPGNEDVIYVAPTYAQAKLAMRIAREKLKGRTLPPDLSRRFVSASALNGPGWRSPQEYRYVIDEFDGVIRGLVGGEVIAVAGTDEDYKIAYSVKRGF